MRMRRASRVVLRHSILPFDGFTNRGGMGREKKCRHVNEVARERELIAYGLPIVECDGRSLRCRGVDGWEVSGEDPAGYRQSRADQKVSAIHVPSRPVEGFRSVVGNLVDAAICSRSDS